jgi:hypothetical protein
MGDSPLNPIVSVKDVVDEMEKLSDDVKAFLNKHTGELISLTSEELSAAEDEIDDEDYLDWQKEAIAEAREVIDSDEYIPLPTSYDIHEYNIMQDFCYSVENERDREILLSAISGRGAFRRFKDMVRTMDIEDNWFGFRREAYSKIAVEWLEENGIPYK